MSPIEILIQETQSIGLCYYKYNSDTYSDYEDYDGESLSYALAYFDLPNDVDELTDSIVDIEQENLDKNIGEIFFKLLIICKQHNINILSALERTNKRYDKELKELIASFAK